MLIQRANGWIDVAAVMDGRSAHAPRGAEPRHRLFKGPAVFEAKYPSLDFMEIPGVEEMGRRVLVKASAQRASAAYLT